MILEARESKKELTAEKGGWTDVIEAIAAIVEEH